MKPKPLLTALLAMALSGGLLWAFPTLWMGLVLVLVGLLTAQATLIRRGLSVVRAEYGAPPLRVSRALEASTATPAFANQNGSSAKPALDPAAFARFRAHLETVEQQRGLRPEAAKPETANAEAAPAAATAKAAPANVPTARAAPADPLAKESAAVTDQVALSAKGSAPRAPVPPTPKVKTASTYGPQRRVVMPGARPGPAPKIAPKPAAPSESELLAEEPEEIDLFEDLRPTREGTLPAKASSPLPPPPDVVGDAIRGDPEEAPSADEAASLLKLAEDAFRRGDAAAARAALDQHLSLVPVERVTWPAHRLQVRLSAVDPQPQLALDAFEAMLKAGFPLKEEGVPALLDELLSGVQADIADSLRVSLLLKVLGVFRQSNNRAAMDQVYRLLIEAQEHVGDERKLVQFLKNHLEIKKVMGEVAGQLEIIDQIGNRLFKLGQTAEAREYYELGLKLRADLQQADTAPTAAKTGTTPQTA